LEKEEYQKFMESLSEEESQFLNEGWKFYEVTFEMKGELLSPIVVELQYTDGTKDYHNIPAEIWRMGDRKVSKVFRSKKDLKQVMLDPYLETADVETANNYYPAKPNEPSRFELFKGQQGGGRFQPQGENGMQRARRAAQREKQGKN
jgi:phage pi2 protein 07